jgi:putative PIN family toxin of toxin-antitoxin system
LRVFVDTNVLISSFIARGLSSEIFRIIIKEHELIVGESFLKEFEKVLLTKFKMPKKQVNEILTFLESFKSSFIQKEKIQFSLRDKNDEIILMDAIINNSEVFITGDKDFIDVRDTLPLKILTPNEFLHLVK